MATSPIAPPAAEPPNTSVCARCGAGLRCGMVAGDAHCWCFQLPHVMPVPSAEPAGDGYCAAFCLCPSCLRLVSDERSRLASPSSD